MQEYPFTKGNRIRLAHAFAHHPRVDIGIDCLLEDQMGAAYVDDVTSPSVFLIQQSGFFCYFAGDAITPAADSLLDSWGGGGMLMPSPGGWEDAIKKKFDGKVHSHTRTRFSSDTLSIDHLEALTNPIELAAQVKQVDLDIARCAEEPFLSINDFDSPEDFVQRGIGYVIYHDSKIIGGAYSSLVSSRAIEVSIFVDDDHRRRGIATVLGCALLKWCLERNLHPNWDAANPESVGLATKLGYTQLGTYTAHYIE